MIGEVRLEFLRKIMTSLVKISRGNTYLEKLETSYKTNMVVIFLLFLILVGIFAKYIDVSIKSKDGELAYIELTNNVNETNKLLKTIRLAYEHNNELMEEIKKNNKELMKDNIKMVNRIKELEKENELLIKNNCKK